MKNADNTRSARKNCRHYHFIGIGGMGMGNLALLMLAKGYRVSGSDVKDGELTRQLREKGATVNIGHDIRNIAGADCVVYSSAVKMDNPEMFHAHSCHIPVLRRAELLAELVNREVGITVAGAHGKTTTSSMASLLLIKAGLKPTTFVGGIVNQGGYNSHLGMGRHIVAEVDESDGSFLYFSPHFSIITNIDQEHMDYYLTFDKVKEAYARFIERTVVSGSVIICGDDRQLRALAEAGQRRFTTYGFSEDNEWVARNIQCDPAGGSYDCYRKGEFFGRFSLSIPGKHNILNSMAVVALGSELKIDAAVIREALAEFSGVRRRFERKGEAGGVLVVDDYGHHPTEIAATLQTARTLDCRRLITVFQPHRYTRTKLLLNEFAGCFNLADHLIITDIYAASEKPIEGVSAETLLAAVRDVRPGPVEYVRRDQLLDHLAGLLRSGDLVLTLGAGDITRLSDELVARLARVEMPSGGNSSVADFGTVGVFMGGVSSEREVSLRSGAAVVQALGQAGCVVKPIDLRTEDPAAVRELVRAEGVQTAFIALHGRFGEDGALQALLDELDIPYNGSGPAASAAAFNKCEAQRLFEAAGVRTPRTLMFSSPETFSAEMAERTLGEYPLVVKPACEGSSIGVSLVSDRAALVAAAHRAFGFGPDIQVQQCIRGRELTVGILGVAPLPVVEIISGSRFFDYDAKYQSGETSYCVPASLPPDITRRVQSLALAAYRAAGCEGFGRVDVLLDDAWEAYVLEINTIPGFTAKSLLPKAAQAAGICFRDLCVTLLEMAYGKKKARALVGGR